ncbi:MAG: glutamine ABC transporter ATP-binding protein GlnQ, partial [Tissierellia bacterium]|nr:glutamine ABC transporter ATP-binding protein GlnQ [Tissierellia bacterium]
ARTLVMRPEIIFFDEPTSALDPALTQEVLNVIKNLSTQKKTMLIVTHEMEFAKNVADKIIFMKDGKILDSGSVEYMINNDNIVIRQFLS